MRPLDPARAGNARLVTARLPVDVAGEIARRAVANGTSLSHELRTAAIRGLTVPQEETAMAG